MRAAGYLVRLWLLACLVLLATTHEEAEEYYGVDQSEDFARVARRGWATGLVTPTKARGTDVAFTKLEVVNALNKFSSSTKLSIPKIKFPKYMSFSHQKNDISSLFTHFSFDFTVPNHPNLMASPS